MVISSRCYYSLLPRVITIMSCCAMSFWIKNCQASRYIINTGRVSASNSCSNHLHQRRAVTATGSAAFVTGVGSRGVSSTGSNSNIGSIRRRIPAFSTLAQYDVLLQASPLTSRGFTSILHSSAHSDIDMIMGVGSTNSNQAAAATIISYDRSAVPSVSSQDVDIVIVGRKSVLQQDDVMTSLLKEQLSCLELENSQAQAMLESGIKGQSGTVSTFLPSSGNKLSICVLPDKVSRNNHPMSLHTMTEQLRSECGGGAGGKDFHIFVLGVKESSESTSITTTTALPGALASAVAKAFPQYSRKTASSNEEQRKQRTIHVTMLDDQTAQPVHDHTKTAQIVSDAVQMAAYLVDMPPNELTTDVYSQVCHSLVTKLNDEIKDDASITLKEIKGEELQHQGYGGIYNVGKAAECPPRLIEMTYVPNPNADAATADAPTTTALVGKAIVFDTGGLSLKSKDGMPGMKHDMGGSAGLLGAFASAVRLNYPKPLTLILCVAENAIGPNNAMRNDDIIKMYSGKTVEINNSDAEGRLVLGDGVAHATQPGRHNILPNKLDLVIDMATLTGAQLVATGKKHAGILATSQELEQRAVTAGLASGDLCFPLLYAPELLEGEFASKVADMKNSVKDRGNAQTSCAGHFIESHLSTDYEGEWLHVDMAGPGTKDERGTGYGVGLILSLLKVPGFV
jgi:probable aminopeptidase NPEPL1